MELNTQEVSVLQRALAALEGGDGRAFDDHLWLGFGDDCGRIHDRLAKGKYIVPSEDDVANTKITDRGRELLGRIGQRQQITT